ncbi:MAG: 50S ribosomal protein L25 [bacterium]|nr:50S ribosomal protein L25 [bacterium]
MITLKAQKREVFGKKVKKLRQQGLIPAELYGRGVENLHLSVPAKDFLQAYKEAGEHSVLSIEIEGKSHPVLIHSVEESHIKPEVLAVDFHEIRMDEKVKAHVPLEFEGEPPAVSEKGGILIKNMDEIEVEALPTDLPHSIVVDLTGLHEFDESIYVKDLPKSDKFEFVVDKETAVVSVTAPKEEEVEEVAPAEGAPTEEGAALESAEAETGTKKEDETKT